MGTLRGFPYPPAMLRGEQSSPAPHAIASGLLFVMRRLVLVGAAVLSMIAACRSADTGAPPAAAIAAPACAARPLVFRPRTGVQYAALTEQQQGSVYASRLAFTPVAGGWRAVESDFSLNRPTPVDVFGELRGAELHWNLDASGVPRGAGEPIGSAKPQYLANMTYYAFAPAGLATKSTCPGTAWEARWEENERVRTFHYRIESAGPYPRRRADEDDAQRMARRRNLGRVDGGRPDRNRRPSRHRPRRPRHQRLPAHDLDRLPSRLTWEP